MSITPPERVPNSIITAALLMWLGAAVYAGVCVAGVVQALRHKQEIRDAFADGAVTYSGAELDQMFVGTVIGIVWVGVVSVLAWAWMAWVNGKGRRWARSMATALGAATISLLVVGMAFGTPGLIGIITWFTVIVGALTIALLWNKESAEYYRTVRSLRRLERAGHGPGTRQGVRHATVGVQIVATEGDLMSSTPPPTGSIGPDGYPIHPGTPTQQPQAAPQVPQPSSIRLAVRLMWAGAALSALGLIVTFLTLDSLKSRMRDQLEKSDANYTQSEFDAVFGVAIGFAVFAALVGVALWVWMAWKNGQGRPWARVVATVFGGFNLLSFLSTMAMGNLTVASAAVAVVSLLLAVVILVLLWRKEASEFYTARSRPQWV